MDHSFTVKTIEAKQLQKSEKIKVQHPGESQESQTTQNLYLSQKNDNLDINQLIRKKKKKKQQQLLQIQQEQQVYLQTQQKKRERMSQNFIQPFNPMEASTVGNIMTNQNDDEMMVPQIQIDTNETQQIISSEKSNGTQSQIPQNTTEDDQVEKKPMNYREEKSQIFIKIRTIKQQIPSKINKQSTHKILGTKICRYCQEVDTPRNKVIQPCKCQRSQQFIHEDCLKLTIIRDYGSRVKDSQCFSCNYKYKMELKSSRKYMPSVGWSLSMDKIPLIALLIFFIMLTVMDSLLIKQYLTIMQSKSSQNSEQFLKSPITLLCFISFCFIVQASVLFCIFLILKNICYVEKIYGWDILAYDPSTQKYDQNLETISFLNQNIEIINGQIKIIKPPEEQKSDQTQLPDKLFKQSSNMKRQRNQINTEGSTSKRNAEVPQEDLDNLNIRSTKMHKSLWINKSKKNLVSKYTHSQTKQDFQLKNHENIYDLLQQQKLKESCGSSEVEEQSINSQKTLKQRSKLSQIVPFQNNFVEEYL